MPPKKKSSKAKTVQKLVVPPEEEVKQETKTRSSRRRAEKSTENIADELQVKKPNNKKVKKESKLHPEPDTEIKAEPLKLGEVKFTPVFHSALTKNTFNNFINFASFDMQKNLPFGKNTKQLEEEYRLIEELMNTENKYNAMRYKQIITDLKSKDEVKILEAVTQLSTELSMAQDETINSFQLDSLIPELINCLNFEGIPDIMMNASISLTQILDIIPQACRIIVNCGGIEILCQKIQNIEYIDVAESAIRALEKVSVEYGPSILECGGMETMLNFLDFFVSATQKSIMNIVSNIFRLVNSEEVIKSSILPVLPMIMSYANADPTRQELMCTMISRLSERIIRILPDSENEKKKQYLESISQDSMTTKFCVMLTDLVDSFDNSKIPTIENILRTLNKLCYYSLPLCIEAFKAKMINPLAKLINILESQIGKETQFAVLAYEVISLINAVLALRATPNPLMYLLFFWCKSDRSKVATYIGIKIMDNAYVEQRVEYFKKNREVVQEILEKLGQRLPALFDLNAGSLYKYLIVISIEKMISFAEVDDLKKYLDLSIITLFISKLIKCNDIMIITISLLTLERVISKMPDAYVSLAREGVIEFVKSLSLTEEMLKLEAYPLSNKKYTNPLESYRQVTNSYKLGGIVKESIDGDRERLEILMNQLRSSEQAVENSSKAFKTLATSLSKQIPEEGFKNSYQNIPKSESLESKSITSLNKQQIDMGDLDYEDEEDEEIALEKSPTIISQLQQESNYLQQQQQLKEQFQQPADKLMELRKEVSAYSIELYSKIGEIVEKSKQSQKLPNSIIEKLEEISRALDKGQLIPTEFGQQYFEEYINLINDHGRVTSYEISTSRILTNLLNFLSDNVIHQSKEEPSSANKSSGNKIKEEERKSPTGGKKPDEIKSETSGDKSKIEINDFQCRIIVGRLISFLYYFRKSKSRDSKNLFIQDFLKNLQEMISNSDRLSGFVSRSLTDYESSLTSDLRFLSQRIKFKAQYLGSTDPFGVSQTPEKKGKQLPNTSLVKQKSTKAEDEKVMFSGASDSQTELFMFKESVFKEIPLLALSVEQFGTLEVIEDYLLNKLNCKEDISGGMYGRNINDFLKEKYEAAPNQDVGSDEEALQTEQQDQDNSSKKSSANKVPVTNPKTKSPGSTTLKKSLSVQKGSSESRFYRNEKKRWIDKYSGKEVNFRKYLEIKFYYKGEEIDKSHTIYELLQKYKKTNIYAGAEDFTIDYKLTIKPNDFNSSFASAKDIKLNSLILTYKAYLQAIFGPISKVASKIEDKTLCETVQMIMLIKELIGFDKRVLCPWSLFNPVIIDLKVKYNFGSLIEAYEKDLMAFKLEQVITKAEFINEKVSNIIAKHVSDPINLSSGQVPEILKILCEHASFLLNYNTKNLYYKMTGFHISRALYYIFQSNKSKLKELESMRIGKLSKKKLRVSRDKILENAVVNMETYGYKKAILEFEFTDEEGTGLGPTLEYFAMVSNEMKNPTHQLWRQTDSNLLYPTPIDPQELKTGDSSKKSKSTDLKRDFEKFQLIFRCIGTLTGRSIIDERIVDLSLEPVFWNIILDKPIFLEDIARIDKSLGATLMGLQEIVNKKQEIEKDDKLTPTQKSTKIRGLTFKNATIEDLALNFVFPGYNDISLIENGEDMPVTLSNLDQYISILASFFLNETLRSQLVAFREGFDKVAPLKNLNIFDAEEIDYLICGGNRDEDWDIKTLEENFVASYGYTANSQSFKNFIKIVSGFNSEEKKLFLKFVTGAERLPYGGFKSLNPKLTVVKRQPNHSFQSPDEYLPSVMTCQNYVKLPDYSSPQMMEKRIKFAMKEGQNSFSLS